MTPSTVFLACIYPILKMAVIVVSGYVLCRRQVLKQGATEVLSQAVIYVALPCLIISKLGSQPNLAAFPGWYWLPLCCLITMFLAATAAWLATVGWNRERLMERRVLVAMCSIHNAGYLPIPIVFSLWPDGEHRLALVMIYILAAGPAVWTVGPLVLRGSLRGVSWYKILNPPLCAILLSFGLVAFGIPGRLKEVAVGSSDLLNLIIGPFAMVGAITIPLILLVLGADLAALPVKAKGDTNWRFQGTLIGVSLIIMPLAGMMLVPLLGLDDKTSAVLLIECLTPTALGVIVQSRLYASEETVETVGRGLFFAYAACFFTIPVFLYLFHLRFPQWFAAAL